MQSQLGLTSIVGWRVRQAADQGVQTVVRELADSCLAGADADATALGALEAAIRLHREDLAAPGVAALVQSLQDRSTLERLADGEPVRLGGVIALLTAVVEQLEGPAADGSTEVLSALITRLVSRIARLRKLSQPPDHEDQTAEQAADDHEAQLVELIDLAPALLRAIPAISPGEHFAGRIRGAARAVLQAVAGLELHRVSLVGGNARRVMLLLETIALAAADPRRQHLARSAIELFDEIALTRLYISGAVAQQPHGTGQDIVRPFGATHIDGMSRPCTTLAWIRALAALRPLMAGNDREGEVDALLELVTHNALLVAVGTDPTRFFGPIPHGLDRSEELDLFGTPPSNHRFAPGPWRPAMRSGGVEEQCCAVSTLLGLSLVPSLSVHVTSATTGGSPAPVTTVPAPVTTAPVTIDLSQLTPSETTGDGWEVTVGGAFPFEGAVHVTVRCDHDVTLRIRVPEWAADTEHSKPPSPVRELPDEGEVGPPTRWEIVHCPAGVTHSEFEFPPTPRLVSPHPLLSDVRGCVALMAGPFVFCLEGADQMGHLQPRQVRFDADGAVTIRREVDHPESHPTVHATGDWHTPWSQHAAPGRRAYRPWEPLGLGLPVDITFVPYYSIANRGFWDVAIWLPLATATDAPR